MRQFDQEQLLKKFQKLPKNIQDAMFSESSTEKISELGKKHNLLLDKTGILAEEVGYFMLGLTHPKDFPSRISESLGVDQAKAREIAEDVNKNIFEPIRNELHKIYDVDNLSQNNTGVPPAPQKSKSFAQKSESFVAPMITPDKKPEQAASEKQVVKKDPYSQPIDKTAPTKTAIPPAPPKAPVSAGKNIPAKPVQPIQPPQKPQSQDPYLEPLE